MSAAAALLGLLGCPSPGGAPKPEPCTHIPAYEDADGDGWGAAAAAPCTPGSVSLIGDCDDQAADISPDAEEVCGDGFDNNCDGRGCAPEGELAPDLVYTGQNPGDGLGASLAVDDLDQDALPELLLGAPGWTDRDGVVTGAVYVVEPLSGALSTVGDAERRIEGTMGDSELGASMVLLDDDGDGTPTLFLGAPSYGSPVTTDGRLYRFEDPGVGARSTAEADGWIDAPNAASRLGGALGAGDDDGDGRSSLAAADSGTDSAIWTATADFSPGSLVSSAWTGAGAGELALLASDLNGDGLDDLVASNPAYETDRGRVWWMAAPWQAGGELSAASGTWHSGDVLELGAALAAGDLDGDGLEDLVIGAPRSASGAGAVFVVRADGGGVIQEEALVWLKGEPDAELGSSIAVVRGGGASADLLVGAPARGSEDARVHLYIAPVVSGAAAAAKLRATGDEWGLGAAVLGGDLDGDDVPELITTAPFDCCAEPAGNVALVLGDRP